MTIKTAILEELIENIDKMLAVIEEQDSFDSDFALVHEVAEQLREELTSLQE